MCMVCLSVDSWKGWPHGGVDRLCVCCVRVWIVGRLVSWRR